MALDMRRLRVVRGRFQGLGEAPIDPATGLPAGSLGDAMQLNAAGDGSQLSAGYTWANIDALNAQQAAALPAPASDGPLLTPSEAALLGQLGTGLIGAGTQLGGAVLRGTTAGGFFQSGQLPKQAPKPSILATLAPYALVAGIGYAIYEVLLKR